MNSQQVDLTSDSERRLRYRLESWIAHVHEMGLDSLAEAFLGAAEPLGPFGAQALWVAQPVLGLFVPTEEIDELARLLDDPAGLAWLRSELTSEDT